jgi:hypothetical protein
LALVASLALAAACARDAAPDAGLDADAALDAGAAAREAGTPADAEPPGRDAGAIDAGAADAAATDADEGRGVPAVVPASTACVDVPRYDAAGEYAVLRPETSQHIVTSAHFAARWDDADAVPLTEAEVLRAPLGLLPRRGGFRAAVPRRTQ